MTPDDLRGLILRQLGDDLECEVLQGRILCNVPLAYPDGDAVTVYVSERNGKFEVTDYSEGLRAVLSRPNLSPNSVAPFAEGICRSLGVHFISGRVSGLTEIDALGDVVWRVASASARIAEASTYLKPKAYRESKFVEEVHATLKHQYPDVRREHRVAGASGHNYRVRFFIEPRNTMLEPIESEAAWSQAGAVYVKFGDLGQTNGYAFMALIDDREKHPDQDVTNLLLQVSEVLLWSRRDDWIGRLGKGESQKSHDLPN